MAKEFKSFTASAAGTFYTVPAGRAAKVRVTYINAPNGLTLNFSSGAFISLGGTVFLPTPGLPVSNAGVPSLNEDYDYVSVNGAVVYAVRSTYYLTAGQTVTLNTSNVVVSIFVIEEF